MSKFTVIYLNIILLPYIASVYPQWRNKRGCGGEGAVSLRGGGGAAISSCICISTTSVGAPIYIWPRAAIPPVPPLYILEKRDPRK